MLSETRHSAAPAGRTLAVLLALYLATSAVDAFIIRPGFGPDEPAHIIYVRSIAERFRLPDVSRSVVNDESSRATHQAHHPPLYYGVMAIVYRAAESCGAGPYGVRHALRLVTIFFGMGWVYLTWLFARETFGSGSLAPLAVAAFVAFLPLSTFMSAVVNNDVPEAMFFTWAMWMMLRAFKGRSLGRREAVMLGIVIGLAILTKAQGLLLVPLLAAAVLLGGEKRTLLRGAAIAAGVAAAMSGWLFIRSALLFGQIIPQTLVRPVFSDPHELLVRFPAFLLVTKIATANLFLYFWTPYWITGRFMIAAGAITMLSAILTVGGAAGVICALLRSGRPEQRTAPRSVLFFAAAAVILLYVSVLYQALFVDWYVFQQGRLMLPGAAAIGVLLAAGLGYFIPAQWRRPSVWAAVMLLAAANWTYLFLVRFFYTIEG